MRPFFPKQTFLILVSLFVIAPVTASDGALLGRVLSKIVCEEDAAQSYALYLPSYYKEDRRWPVIFCFDPSARGQIPVQKLQAAAEKYGYVVAGSLNSRNGPFTANAVAVRAMVKDVTGRLSIDPQRLYATGMSGGARVAAGLGQSGSIRGVIGCGAGFPVTEEGIPEKVPFAFYGIVGNEDFNYGEMIRLGEDLEKRKAVYRIAFFAGPHVWPSAEEFTKAVEWLDWQAMRAGLKPKDAAFAARLIDARKAEIAGLAGLEKWRELKALAADFSGESAVAEIAAQAAKMASGKEVKDGLRTESRLFAREGALIEEMGDLADSTGLAGKQRFAAKLRTQMDVSRDAAERSMFRRAIAGYCSMAQETSRELTTEKEYGRALALLEMMVTLRPEHARGWFDFARVLAFDSKRGQASEALDKAALAGFDDAERVEKEPAFNAMRADAAFQAALEKIRKNRTDPVTEMPAMKISSVFASVELRLFHQPKAGEDQPPLAFLKVVSVRPGSAAAKAGVVNDLEITSIQGRRIKGLTESELSEQMGEQVRGEIVFTVREPFQEKERTLRIPVVKQVVKAGEATAPATTVPEDAMSR